MKTKTLATLILPVILSAFAVAGVARQNTEPQAPPVQGQGTPGMMTGGMMSRGIMSQGMMNGGMTGMMGQMMAHHAQMTELMGKLQQRMAAIEKEKDPAALKGKLAKHRALLEQMHNLMIQQGGMMQGADGAAANCPMTGATEQPESK
jgi:hypothetical protein